MSSTTGQKVGLFIPDLIAFDAIVVDTKVIDRIADHERGLMLNYLRITGLRVGVIYFSSAIWRVNSGIAVCRMFHTSFRSMPA